MALTNYVAVFKEVRHDDTLCTVHAPGCADIAKSLKQYGGFSDEVELDFDAEDFTANMKALDPDELGYEWANVGTPRCATNHATKARRAAAKVATAEQAQATDKRPQTDAKPRRPRRSVTTPAAAPQPTTGARRARRNGPAQEEAAVQADAIIAKATRRSRSQRVGEEVDGKGHQLDYGKRAMHLADNHPTPLVEPSTTESGPARLATCDDETYALALRVRELRAGGTAWWRIAHEMELPGHGPSVASGKTGAAKARRLWAQAWGNTYSDTSVPRDTKASKEERARTAPPRPFFTDDTPDEEVAQALAGKEITWYTRLSTQGSMVVSEQKAQVAPKATSTVKVVQGREGRVVEFHELIPDDKGMLLVGPRRSVYVNRIEKVGL